VVNKDYHKHIFFGGGGGDGKLIFVHRDRNGETVVSAVGLSWRTGRSNRGVYTAFDRCSMPTSARARCILLLTCQSVRYQLSLVMW